jgi:hypothetical protein
MSIEESIRPYLDKHEKIENTLMLKKLTCCFTDKRMFIIYRKFFGFKRYFVEIEYKDVIKAEAFSAFNSIFFLYGIFLLVTNFTRFTGNYFIITGIALTTFVIVFLFPIKGIIINYQDGGRAEVLGSKNEMIKVSQLLKEKNIIASQ